MVSSAIIIFDFYTERWNRFSCSKENVLIYFNITINQAFEKKKTNFSSNLVPVGLDFTDAYDPSMFTMRICRASCKRTSTKYYQSSYYDSSSNFYSLFQKYDLASFYLLPNAVINCECNMQWLDKRLVYSLEDGTQKKGNRN